MAVLAASITTSSGKPLLSRQFKQLSKDRVLELLSNFQNLVGNIASDHTFIEDEHVRYVYKPFDDYYIILVTNRQSNIIQDLDTLNLFSQTVTGCLSSFDEYEIFDNAFEILSSFDEIIAMGYKENLSMGQVATYLSMESHEEKIQEIIERNKEIEATEERKRRAKEIARKEQERKNGMFPSDFEANRFQTSNDPNVANAYNSYYSHASPAAQQSYQQQLHHTDEITQQQPHYTTAQHQGARSGMKLGGGNTRNSSTTTRHQQNRFTAPAIDQEEAKATNNGILISINETVNAQFNREGDIQSSELKGVLELRINDPELAHANLKLVDSVDVKDRSYQFKTHPNIDKSNFTSNGVISLRDKKKSFPSNDQSLGVLRWRKIGKADDKSLIPLDVSTWVTANEDNGLFDVTIEFEVNEDYNKQIEDLYFIIPIFAENDVAINEDSNDCKAKIISVDDEQGIIIKVDEISPANPGIISFSVAAEAEDALFPINVTFKHTETANDSSSLVGVGIGHVSKREDDNEELPYDVITTLKSEEYVIV